MGGAPSLTLIDSAHSELHEVVLAGVRGFNRGLFPGHPEGQDLAIALHDGQNLVGGLLGRTAGGWLAIELLFVPEYLRKRGLASKLIAMAEEEAVRRGCHAAWLDTLNPQAHLLYERLGYKVFGELRDYPAGSSRVFLKKDLQTASA
jgi:ribosomal protein S18 acetylase RimI-like enzyme